MSVFWCFLYNLHKIPFPLLILLYRYIWKVIIMRCCVWVIPNRIRFSAPEIAWIISFTYSNQKYFITLVMQYNISTLVDILYFFYIHCTLINYNVGIVQNLLCNEGNWVSALFGRWINYSVTLFLILCHEQVGWEQRQNSVELAL